MNKFNQNQKQEKKIEQTTLSFGASQMQPRSKLKKGRPVKSIKINWVWGSKYILLKELLYETIVQIRSTKFVFQNLL